MIDAAFQSDRSVVKFAYKLKKEISSMTTKHLYTNYIV